MGCARSRMYHEIEKGIDHADLEVTAFDMQQAEVVQDLDTDNDQKGRVAVDCIFRPTREIYGQRAQDMIEELVKWSDYGITFEKRPYPHDFPAFAHEKPAAELAQLHQQQEQPDINKSKRPILAKLGELTDSEVEDVGSQA